MNTHENYIQQDDDSSTELQRLLSELLDGGLEEANRLRLHELLRGNPACQDEYLKLMAVHALLHLDFSQPGQFLVPPLLYNQRMFPQGAAEAGTNACTDVVAQIDAQLESPPAAYVASSYLASSPAQESDRALSRSHRRYFAGMTALAASLLFVAWFVSPLGPAGRESARSAKLRDEFANRDIRGVAVLAQSADAQWSHVQAPLEVGAPLPVGRFQLDQGLVQIEFFSGATVIVEAPADFELTSSMRLVCNLGKIRANVPSQAQGFTIETPKYSAVDLGTEFTVHVDNDGESEIHVLNGEVELWDRLKKDTNFTELLTTGRGVRTTPGGSFDSIDTTSSNFVGSEQFLEISQAVLHERFKDWQKFSDEIRTAPHALLYYGFDDHAPWERVLRNNSSNTDKRLDGAIVGCHWTSGRWNGKQALEFKRTSDRVRLNVPGEFESLSLTAWVRIEGLERWLSSLMLTDGHQPGEIHWQMTELGQLMLGVKAEPDKSHDFYSPSVISPIDLGRWVHLGCVYNGDKGYVAHFLDGEEISREKVRIPTRLRIGAAEIGNWVPEDLLDNRVRSLNGRLDEFIMFDSPLTNDEIKAIYEAGKLQ